MAAATKKQTAYKTGGKNKKGQTVMNKYEFTPTEEKSSFPIKTFFYFCLAIILFLVFYYLHNNSVIVWFDSSLERSFTVIAIDFNFEKIEIEHYFWSIAISLLMGVYLTTLIPLNGERNVYITAVLVCFIIGFAILNLGYLGIRLFLNFPFLNEKTYISNSVEGAIFMIQNFAFLTIIFVMSFFIESEA
jgi:hypothetical protein